jgi:hypothetical protein
MKVKSSGTVAPKQLSWRKSNRCLFDWRHARQDHQSKPPRNKTRQRKRPVTCDGLSRWQDQRQQTGRNQWLAGAEIPPV